MPSIRDLAHKAHVSIATASRVLNNHPNVSQATRLVVIKTAREIGYPLTQFQDLPQLSLSILVLSCYATDPNNPNGSSSEPEFDRTVWMGVHAALEQHNIAARLQHSRMLVEEAQAYARDVGISALVLLGGVLNRDFAAKLADQKLPFVVVGSHLRPMEVNVVMADVMRGARLAVDHLVEGGRQKIGLVNGPMTTTTSEEKFFGYRLAFSLCGLPYDPDQVVSGDFTPEDGYACTRALMTQRPDLEAIIYADDRMALGGLQALKEMGRRVPEDVSITGFGNYEIARYTDPPLTSIYYDMHQMGVIAAQRICNLLSEPDGQALCIVVPVNLIARESSGNPSANSIS